MFDFKITPDGADAFEVSAGSRDVVQWEKTTRGASFGQLAENLKMGDLYKLAWLASKRTGKWDGTLADFEAGVELLFEETPEPDPTQPAP